MTALRRDAEKSPVSHLVIVTLLAIGLVSLPVNKLFDLFIKDTLTATLSGGIVVRLALSVVAIVFISKYGYKKQFFSVSGIGLLAVIPALIVAINNFPIIGYFTDKITVTANTTNIALYIIYCLSVGLFEELVFRGIVFPLSLKITGKKKLGVFWAVALSSAVFGGAHLINIIGGANIGATFLQVGYSFLIGAMCAISVCVSKNLIVAVVLHFIYDIGGLMLNDSVGIAYGLQWDTVTVIITAVLGVIVLVYMTVLTLKLDYKTTYSPYELGVNE